jgi:hypothetical protein
MGHEVIKCPKRVVETLQVGSSSWEAIISTKPKENIFLFNILVLNVLMSSCRAFLCDSFKTIHVFICLSSLMDFYMNLVAKECS